MSTGRQTIRTIAAAFAVSLAAFPFANAADAGCLDWLFGRTPTYTANYAPYSYQSVGVPVTTTPVGTPITSSAYPTSGAYQAQRPAYGTTVPINQGLTTVQTFDNPSVYTGMPVSSSPQILAGQQYAQRPVLTTAPGTTYLPQTTTLPSTTSYRLPISSSATYGQSFAGQSYTANRVPISSTLRGNAGINPITSSSPYVANFPSSVAPVSYSAVPPGSVQALPLETRPRWRFGSGLSRFFNSLLGRNTNYVTSYYRAPITYYRPMTTVDPVSGTTVTVQQPCSSYVQQLQRVPHNTFLPMQSGNVVMPTTPNACSTPMLGSTYSQSTLPLAGTPGSFTPSAGGIGQVGGQSFPGDPGVTTIPSTIPESNYPNTAPLTGGSSGMSGGSAGSADNDPVPQPRIESNRPELSGASDPETADTSDSSNGQTGDYFNDLYGDDVYPYGNPKSDSGTVNQGGTDDKDRPAIQLDPPVTNQMRNQYPSDRFGAPKQFTTQTPPSMRARIVAPGSADPVGQPSPEYSTLRPIGVPTDTTGSTQPQPIVEPPSSRALQPPPLPAPSGRAADSSALFRNTENSASARMPSRNQAPSRNQVTVPVREATTRHQSIRQVTALEDIAPRPATRQSAPVQRDSGGWLPAR